MQRVITHHSDHHHLNPSVLIAPTLAAAVTAGVAAAPSLGIRLGLPSGSGGGAPIVTELPEVTPTPAVEPTARPSVRPSGAPVTRPPVPTQTPIVVPIATPIVTPEPTVPQDTPLPTAAPTAGPDYSLPGGIYLDVLTPHHAYGDWSITLLDTIYMLPADYYPGDLVDSGAAGLNGGYAVRSFVIADLAAMAEAARAAGAPIGVVSGFRSHTQQQTTFDYWVSVGGYEQALRTSARAGHSEHQLGTALDFTSEAGGAPWEHPDWATTPAGAWMAANAWRYGFVMSYPAGRFAETGYDYEPWHYRYVGRDLAAAIAASGATPRGYLYELQ
jgi:D-alanyl-D-alanine carboxypeptidase